MKNNQKPKKPANYTASSWLKYIIFDGKNSQKLYTLMTFFTKKAKNHHIMVVFLE